MPNPVDMSIETEDNSQRSAIDLDVDLLFCGELGEARDSLAKAASRDALSQAQHEALDGIIHAFFFELLQPSRSLQPPQHGRPPPDFLLG